MGAIWARLVEVRLFPNGACFLILPESGWIWDSRDARDGTVVTLAAMGAIWARLVEVRLFPNGACFLILPESGWIWDSRDARDGTVVTLGSHGRNMGTIG